MRIQHLERTIIILAALATILSASIVARQALNPPEVIQAVLQPCQEIVR